MTIHALRQRIHDRIYGDIVQRWHSGKLDDRQFDRAYRLRAQLLVPPIFLSLFVLAAVGDWLERDISTAEHLSRIGNFALLFGVFWLTIGAIIDRNARFGTRDMLLRRVRDAAERQPPIAARAQVHGDDELEFRNYTRTTRYWNLVLVRVVAATALVALLTLLNPRAQLFLVILAPVVLWALIARFDRRPYLNVSPEGIWCRAWGKHLLAFNDFKAAYPRQNRMGDQGVVLVPYNAATLAPKLSWEGRLALRSGESVPAHAGTLTIWTSKVGLDRDALLRGLLAEIGTNTYREQEPRSELRRD